MSAYWKIPLQALVLLIGVLMFVFYLFTPPPMLFNPVHDAARARERARRRVRGARAAVRRGGRRAARRRPQQLAARASGRRRRRRDAADAGVHGAERRGEAACAPRRVALVKDVSGDAAYNDVNYVFPTFIIDAAAGRAGRAADRGDLRGGDVDDRRRSCRRCRRRR